MAIKGGKISEGIFNLAPSSKTPNPNHSPFYSAPSIFAVFRNLVREIWFKKSGSANSDFFSGSRKVVNQKNRWDYTINPPFFRLEKSGSANLYFFLVRENWLTRKKGGFILLIHLFSGWRKMVLQTRIFFWFEKSG